MTCSDGCYAACIPVGASVQRQKHVRSLNSDPRLWLVTGFVCSEMNMLLAAICCVLSAGCTNTVSQAAGRRNLLCWTLMCVGGPSVGITGRVTFVARPVLFNL